MGGWGRDAAWEPRHPPRDPEPPGRGEAWPILREWGRLPALPPELGRIAATWAAGQAAERNQWALELWRATEEKRATLVALRQSEETLHQVWRQLRPPWPGPPTAVPPASPQSGRTPGSPATGSWEAMPQGRREQAGVQVTTSLREGRAPGAGRPQAEPPAEEEARRRGGQRWGYSEQEAQAGSGRQERPPERRGRERGGPGGGPLSQQGGSSCRWIYPSCPPPPSRNNTELIAALGQGA